ncbi:MAG: helix-turn-helix transcriptional regulator [Clostridia bacterium]|nr:helix-turn-helix transcriptional regulator [Clostridia bacterium]
MQKIRQDIRLGHNIRAMRISAYMTQEQVVAQMQLAGCDISRSIYSQIEGGTYNIRVSELVVLAGIFDVDYNAFFQNIRLDEEN